jgi:hypothetical protein
MRLTVVLAVFLLGCGKSEKPALMPDVPAETAAEFGTGVISGSVRFDGVAPKPSIMKMNADPFCHAAHSAAVTNEELLVNSDGTLRNVFVYIKSGAGHYPAPKTPVTLEQLGCLYCPRVQGIQAGQPLRIRNGDDTLHNVHCLAEKNSSFNIGQPTIGMEAQKVFQRAEVMLRFKCDVHPWMTAWLGVLEHPFFAVTGTNGVFTLARLPAGEYVVEAWHEKLGTREQKIALQEGEGRTLEFTFDQR